MPLDLHEVSGLPETLAELRAEIEALSADRRDRLIRGSSRIGELLGLSGSAVRRRKLLDPDPPPVFREGRDLVAWEGELRAWAERNRNGSH
jgi:hypothetical protein